MVELPTEFSITDVRCFQGLQKAQIRPITLLIGENSTGKSTFLGCYSVAHQMFVSSPLHFIEPDFNINPFLMGSFREIVRTRRGPSGRIDEFELSVSFSIADELKDHKKRAKVKFIEKGTQPSVSSIRYFIQDDFLEFQRTESNNSLIVTPNTKVPIDIPFDIILRSWPIVEFERIIDDFIQYKETVDYLERFRKIWYGWKSDKTSRRFEDFLSKKLTALAPLRAQPKRTYDPIRETASPEGEHVPMLMMRLTRSNKNQWIKLHDQLVKFGLKSGLFSDIKVKGHGGHMSDPFQLQVKAKSGSLANIMDVGYGVSQSLPILVDVIGASDEMFILQQPEVHLHPRSQAELTTFFIDSAQENNNCFLIETHSDYVVDRVRINVRQGRIQSKDVSILYFEPKGNSVYLHNLSLDDNGNLNNTPTSYREFFTRETDQLLGFND